MQEIPVTPIAPISNTCPSCHTAVRVTDFYCFNCGTNLHPEKPSTTVTAQIWLYVKSAVLVPFGIFWAIPYLRQSDKKSRIIGWVSIIITVVVVIYLMFATKYIIEKTTGQLNQRIDTSLYY